MSTEEFEYAVSCGKPEHDCNPDQPEPGFGLFRDLEVAERRAKLLHGRAFRRPVNPWTPVSVTSELTQPENR